MDDFENEKRRKQADAYIEDYMKISELSKLFHTMIKLWNNYEDRNKKTEYLENNEETLYQIKMSIEQAKIIAFDFYKNIGLDKEYNQILNKKNIEINIGITEKGNNIWSSGIQETEENEHILNIRNHESIKTLFIIVHEFMHAMTLYTDFNETKYILREVPPHITELLLYNYLLDNNEKYNLDKEDLKHDIILSKFMRFTNYSDKTNRCLRQDYIIALLINTQLEKLEKNIIKEKLIKLLNIIEKDNMIETLEELGLKLNRKTFNNRKKYIEDMFENYINLFEKLYNNEKSKTHK